MLVKILDISLIPRMENSLFPDGPRRAPSIETFIRIYLLSDASRVTAQEGNGNLIPREGTIFDSARIFET